MSYQSLSDFFFFFNPPPLSLSLPLLLSTFAFPPDQGERLGGSFALDFEERLKLPDEIRQRRPPIEQHTSYS